MKTKMLILILSIIGTLVSFGKTIEVKGKVYDADTKEKLVGASIKVKGTSTNAITDLEGAYRIYAEPGSTLEFSYVGYDRKLIVVKTSVHDVYLKASSNVLNETVVVGYGAKRMTSTTGAVSNVLGGRVAGIAVTNMQGSPGIYYQPNPVVNDDTEEYGNFKENKYIRAKDEALSTFSLDVDAASYSNMRRIINMGQCPPKDAIRTEELINYFSYNYPQPAGDKPVNIVTETAQCPWESTHQLFRIGVKAREIPAADLPASNLVFLLDVSGSMSAPNKLDLIKSSIKLLVNNLRAKDRVSIVVYAGAAGVVLPSTEGNDKQKIMEAVANLQAGGSTAGGAGIELAYQIAEKNFIKEGNNRIILCTDGDFNVGVSDNHQLEDLISEKRKSGVFLTVLGYGMGNYKDVKLQTLAEKGNGNHAYIDNLQEANKVLVNEFGSTMYTVAKDVKIQVEFNPRFVEAYRLIGYESRLLNKEDFNNDAKDAGELGSGHTVTALYEIIPVGVKNPYGNVDELKYQKNNAETNAKLNNSDELLTVKLRYKEPDGNTSKKIEIPVKAHVQGTEPTDDFQFVMAVSMFGQLLRDSEFKGSSSFDKVIELARNGLGTDTHGYRHEFIRLAESMKQLTAVSKR